MIKGAFFGCLNFPLCFGEAGEIHHLSPGFTTLWRHFLQQVRRAKRRRRFQDPEGRGFSAALLERLGAEGGVLMKMW